MRKVRIAKYHCIVTTRLGTFSLQREADLGACAEEVWMLIDPEGGITVHGTESKGMDGVSKFLRLEPAPAPNEKEPDSDDEEKKPDGLGSDASHDGLVGGAPGPQQHPESVGVHRGIGHGIQVPEDSLQDIPASPRGSCAGI